MIMTNETRELRDLRDYELDLVTGGSPCRDARALFKEASDDFKRGIYLAE
jgi:hypothetical protein